jgi:hypothetical protein
MTGSIRDLKGFSAQDVFQLLRSPTPPEEVALASYTFLPYVRSGVAATLTEPFATTLPWQARIDAALPVVADDGPLEARVSLSVRGPGDVKSLDSRQVIRTYPPADKHNAETEYLAHIEFDRPDLPWMFTPAGPDANGRLVPWITLVVVPDFTSIQPGQHGGLPVLDVDRALLPPLQDAWAWAHAQVMGTHDGPPSIGDRLAEVNPTLNLSRVLCPLHLQPDTAYLACVVPTFAAGRQAGLQQPVTTTLLDFAWSDADQRVQLPVYYQWRFSTSALGNFEELARRIVAFPAPPGVGRHRLDTSRPGGGVEDLADGDSGREQVIVGPIYSINQPAPGEYPSEAEQQWPSRATDQLEAQLEAGDVQLRAPAAQAETEPVVGPPLYASNHIARVRVDATTPPWFAALNQVARNRVVAGLGTRVVQMDQEALMASAWNQVGAIDTANRTLHLAQFARYAAASIYRRHLQPLNPATLLGLTGRVHARLLAQPGLTVRARLSQSSLPVAATSAHFRRLTRLRGPMLRFKRDPSVISRLVADDAGVTRDWQRAYLPPDGVVNMSSAGLALVDQVAAAGVLGVTDPTAGLVDALAARSQALASIPSLPDSLTADAVARLSPPLAQPFVASEASGVLQTLLANTPNLAVIRRTRAAAIVGSGKAMLIREFVHAEAPFRRTWTVSSGDLERLGILADPDIGPHAVNDQALMAFANQVDEAASQYGLDGTLDLTLERSLVPPMINHLTALNAVESQTIVNGLAELSGVMFAADTPQVPSLPSVNVGDLNLLQSLEPGLTVTNRIKGRLAAATLPVWLRPDWFDNRRVEPVMAAPKFPHAMYEALYRYDRDWLIPGVARMPGNDLVTLLVTNNLFVEAFLIGLNHEMARTLLWRGYPTDQRGTYFRSFWTTGDELQQPLHTFTDVPLGQHMDPRLEGRVVLLIRGELIHRYPGVVAHLTQAAGLTADGVPVFGNNPPATVLFRIFIEPNLLLVGFDATSDDMRNNLQEWFTLSENPTEPRFGLDDNNGQPSDLKSREDLAWADFGTPNGSFLRAQSPVLAVDQATWGSHSAAAAHLLFQLPARAAYPAAAMIQGSGG